MLQKNLKNPSRKTETPKTKLNKRSFVSAVTVSLVALLLCTSFTFSWLTSKIDYLNTVIRMGEFSATVNVYYEDGSLLTTGTTQGEDVAVDNAISSNTNWSAGSVGYRFIEVDNTGTINLSSYLSLGFNCANFNGTTNQITDSFFVRVTDITSAVKSFTASGNKLSGYMAKFKPDTASGIQKTGTSFTKSTDIQKLGVTVGGGKSYYLFEYCCYDLSPLLFSNESTISIDAKIRVQQTSAPAVKSDKGLITANSEKTSNDSNSTTKNTSVVPTSKSNTEQTTKPSQTSTTPAQTTVEPTTTASNTQPTETKPTGDWEVRTLNGGKTCEVLAYNGSKKTVEVPTKIGDAVVVGMGSNVFSGTSVEKVTLPATVSNLDASALDVKTIKSVEIKKENKVDGITYTSPYSEKDLVVYSADKTMLIKYLSQKTDKEYTVDNNTVAICDNAFSGVSLKTLDLATAKSVSSTAFENADIENFVFHTIEPPVVSSMNAFGEVKTEYKLSGVSYKADTVLHVPEEGYDNYSESMAFEGYAKAKAIKKDSAVGSCVAKVKKDGLVYSIIKNDTEYDGVKFDREGKAYLAVVTGYYDIPEDGVVKVLSSLVYTKEDKETGNKVAYSCPVVGIADNAFANAKAMKILVLPDKNVHYSSDAFPGCDDLGLIDYDSVLPFDVSKFDAIFDNTKTAPSEVDDSEDKE
ncbi:MAG: leucine-rich repeat protein [Ruminococcus sp.]